VGGGHSSGIPAIGEVEALVMSPRPSPAAGRTRAAFDDADFGTEAANSPSTSDVIARSRAIVARASSTNPI